MLRPAERFSVNIVHKDDYIGPQPPIFRPSPMTLVVLAAILGVGMGGILPAAWGPARYGSVAVQGGLDSDLARIEPAAGPSGALAFARAADRGFYAPVLLDGIAITMQLGPDTPASSLAAQDARRLAAVDDLPPTIPVERLRLGGMTTGPLTLPVSEAEVSVLGADLLQRFGPLRIDERQLVLGTH